MLHAYLNYPNSKVSVHGDASCSDIQQNKKVGQRHVHLTHLTIGSELPRFFSGGHPFASHSGANDMWLELDFADPAFERALVQHIQRLLAARYTPFGNCIVEEHC